MNIDKMIEKLDEIEQREGVTYDVHRKLLLAGKEPLPKELKIGGYQELALRIVESNKRIGELEAKLGGKVRIEELERRVTELNALLLTVSNRGVDLEKRVAELEYCLARVGVKAFQKKDAPAVEKCGHKFYHGICPVCARESMHATEVKPEAKPECKLECGHYWHIIPQKHWDSCFHQDKPKHCPTCREEMKYVKPSAAEGQVLEDAIASYLFCSKEGDCRVKAKELIRMIGSHSLPKDKIIIDRKLAEDFMERKYWSTTQENDMTRLQDELRKALGAERGEK